MLNILYITNTKVNEKEARHETPALHNHHFSLNIFLADIPRCEAIYADTDLPGNDIDSVLDVATSEECQDLCIQNSACTFYTWVDDSYTLNPAIIHKCHLKNGNSGTASVTGLFSGAATC